MSRTPTPLRDYLDRRQVTLTEMQQRLAEHLPNPPSQPSMSQWSSGRRMPSARIQIAMMLATDGEITPLDWVRWRASLEEQKHLDSARRGSLQKIHSGGEK